jgi:hypothetical protein
VDEDHPDTRGSAGSLATDLFALGETGTAARPRRADRGFQPGVGGDDQLHHMQGRRPSASAGTPSRTRRPRRRGKGRKGQRRIQRIEQAGKAWATPIQALLVAERCAALSGHDTDFVMIITVAYTAMRWSEVIGLSPDCIQDDHVDVSWKLYELNGRFYRGRPKDGSIRPADLPPFLAGMLANQVSMHTGKCTRRNTEKP